MNIDLQKHVFFGLVFQGMVSLCSHGCSGTHFVDSEVQILKTRMASNSEIRLPCLLSPGLKGMCHQQQAKKCIFSTIHFFVCLFVF